MTATERAIRDAVETGQWDASPSYRELKTKMSDVRLTTVREMDAWQDIAEKYVETFALLDPAFWQALGRARVWPKSFGNWYQCPSVDNVSADPGEGNDECIGCNPIWSGEVWMYHWHCLIDALAAGKSIEEFFISLEG